MPNAGGPNLGNADFLAAVPTLDLFDALASRYNPQKLSREPFAVAFDFSDTGETIRVEVGRDVVVPRDVSETGEVAATLSLARSDFNRLILREAGVPQLMESGALTVDGDGQAAAAFLGALDQPDFWFPVVTP